MKGIIALLMASLAALSGPAGAAQLASGQYRCETEVDGALRFSGDLAINGSTYQGPAFGGDFRSTYDYQLDDVGAITWNGPLGALSRPAGRTAVGQLTSDAAGLAGFDIVLTDPDGGITRHVCKPHARAE